MPHILTQTSVKISAEKELAIKEKLGKAISLLSGKSEQWLMLTFRDECHMYFRGDGSKPTAFIEVQVFGKINPAESEELTKEICNIISSELLIPSDRIYVKYEEVTQWGFDGMNF